MPLARRVHASFTNDIYQMMAAGKLGAYSIYTTAPINL